MTARQLLQLFLLSAVWGISFLMMRIALPSFPPLWISLLRCTLGAGLLWAALKFGGNSLPPRRLAPWLVLIALLNNVVPFTFFAWGERTVASNLAAVLNATVPIWTLLFSLVIFRLRTTLMTIAGVLLSFAGVLLVVAQANAASDPVASGAAWSGVLIIALAAVSYAMAALIAKVKLHGLDPLGLATTQLTLASLMLLPLALLTAHPSSLRAAPLAAIAVLGIAGSGIAYLLYYRLLAEISATQLAAVTYLMPIWGLLWGLTAGETIALWAYGGVALTIIGLVLMNRRPTVQVNPVR